MRQRRTGAFVEETIQDARYAVRGLRRTPGFTLIAVLTLGLGMGMNTAVFSVADAAMFRPLPYDRPDELVYIRHTVNAGTPTANFFTSMTWREASLWMAEPGLFAGMAARDSRLPEMAWREQGRTIRIAQYTAGTPELLGVAPLVGRSFSAKEADAAAPVLVLSEEVWTRAFDRSDAALGAVVTLNGTPYTVIGVMPRTFRFGPGGDGRGSELCSYAADLSPASRHHPRGGGADRRRGRSENSGRRAVGVRYMDGEPDAAR